jgi:hypothetical protein
MEHAVFYPGPDGAPAFRRFASVDEAVGFVEHLRNVEGVEDVSVQMLTPVPLAFRAYYRVEMPAAEVPAVPEQAVPEQAVAVEPVVPDHLDAEVMEPVAAEPMPGETAAAEPMVMEPVALAPDVAANGKRSLGFFAH